MRRVLLICAAAVLLALPAVAAGAGARARTGWLVVRDANNDGGLVGSPVATVVVRGFVIGRIADQGSVEIYQLGSSGGAAQPQATGPDVAQKAVYWRGVSGSEWTGTGFRFRAVGVFRVVVHGSGVYLFAGGGGNATLQGSSVSPAHDGSYALDGGRFRSLPTHARRLRVGDG